MPDDGIGALAAALAKAQAAFPAITRDKEVTVTSKRTGSTYKFKYAPLDKIIEKVRKPLADNGLAVAQLLDSDPDGAPALVTMLLHADGGQITGRTPIPHSDGDTAQEFGSAVTYLRRYALTALLGIATEDDDDGNAAAGNAASFGQKAPDQDGLIGVAEKTDKMTGDYQLRQSPDGAFIGFRLKGSPGSGVLVEAHGALAEALAAIEADVIGKRVQVWGSFVTHPLSKGGSWKAYSITRIATPDLVLPAPGHDSPPVDRDQAEIDALPLFNEAA